MLVYGKNVARDLLKSDIVIKKVFLQDNFNDNEIIALVEKKKVDIKRVSKKELDSLCSGVTQGIILSIPDYKYSDMSSIDNEKDDVVVVLDHLEDPHNLGAIIRTCEAA